MKVVTNEEFYCQTKRNRESWRERALRERKKETVTSFRGGKSERLERSKR